MLITHQHPHNKSIMISLLGKPNAGKSTLINTFLGFDLSIVSNKPQTTRNQFHCALSIDRTEIIFVDTPGLHKSSQELNLRMNGQAQIGAEGVDLNFLLMDLTSEDIIADFKEVIDTYNKPLSKTWIIFTKLDLVDEAKVQLDELFKHFQSLQPSLEKYFVISAKKEKNIEILTGAIIDEAPEGPHLYPDGSVSNKNQRFFASEYIREQSFKTLKDELPYELAVVIEDYSEPKKGEKGDTKISASILVNRPSQRAIVVGKKGSVIKEIGTKARKKIEAMTDSRVHLNLHVKVSPKWFRNNFVLDEIGLPRVAGSHRVWRKKS